MITPPWKRPALSVSVLLALIILIGLGTWQLQRLQWKLDLIDTVESRIDSAPMTLTGMLALPPEERSWQPVRFRATAVGDRVAKVVGTHDGQAGYFVFSLVTLANGGELPVNHGFVAQEDEPEAYDLMAGEITGLYRPAAHLSGLAKSLTPAPDREAGIFYARNAEGPIAWLFDGVVPPEAFYIDRTDNAAPQAVPRGGTSRVSFTNNHLSYALTWYGLALGLVLVYGLMMRPGKDL